MMAKSDYSEDKMIQEAAAIILGDELGWTSINALHEAEGSPTLTGRGSFSEVVLRPTCWPR